MHSRAFFDITGTALCAILCAGLALLPMALLRDRRKPWQITANLVPLLLPLVDVFGGAFQPWRGPVLLTGSLALAALFLFDVRLTRRAGFLLAIALPLAVYLPDLSPYVGRADTFEFQIVAPQLGIAHPSGYPLYILVGKLFSLLPLGSVAWRVNLSSAVCAALASGMMYLALNEWPPSSPPQGGGTEGGHTIVLFAALTLAFSLTLWARSIEAEVYALNALLVATALWLVVRWTSGKLVTATALPLLGLLTGIAMTSHITLGALLFLTLPLMLAARPRPTWRTLLLSAALGLSGLGLYLYIPLRWPAVNDGAMMSPAHFLRFVTNAESGGALHPLALVQDPARWSLVLRLLRMQVGWIGLALALWGVLQLFRRRWPLALGSLLAFGAWVWFNLSFYVADPDYSAFLIPGHVMLVFWMGVGMARGEWRMANKEWRMENGEGRGKRGKGRGALYVSLLALLPLSRLWTTGPTLDTISVGRDDKAWARYALQQPLAEGAAVLADSEKFPPLYYLQQIEGVRPDLELVTLFNEAQYRAALEQRLDAGQRVYLARYLPGMDAFGVSAVGPLVEVRPPALPVTATVPPEARFGDSLTLRSHRLEADPEGRPMDHLTLVWHALDAIDADLTVRLRLTDRSGNVAWQSAASRPLGGYTTTQAWRAGHTVQDYHPLHWPQWLVPGDYHLEIGVFPRFAETGLPVDGTAEPWFRLEDVLVHPGSYHPLPRRLNALFDGAIWLIGADFPEEANAGGPLTVDLTWQRGSRQAPHAVPELRWIGGDGVVQVAQVPRYGAAPRDWPAGRPQTLRYTITTPQQPGQYTLSVGWRRQEIGDNHQALAARCGWLGAVQADCALGAVQVRPADAGLANFDNRLLLLDAVVDAGAVAAGGQLRVDLRWRGLRAVDKDYTVFVQIIGPDGKLYGQADSWPVQGARPTSGWHPGEEIVDEYDLYLKEGAPSGQYRVIVGWYLLADMRRLPVVDAVGQTVGDFYTTDTFTVP